MTNIDGWKSRNNMYFWCLQKDFKEQLSVMDQLYILFSVQSKAQFF